jgi:hypothetical protein
MYRLDLESKAGQHRRRMQSHGMRIVSVAMLVCLAASPLRLSAEGFATKTAPTLTPAKVAGMECRYFTELLGTHSKAQVEKQLEPIAATDVNTVVCCPMGWRFYNFPSEVDTTWKEPGAYARDVARFPNWQKMVDNLKAGGDPLRDALEAVRRLKKGFIISVRMNDNHYVDQEEFPTHNNFWRAHPEYRLDPEGKSTAPRNTRVFNYLMPEVRDFYFAVIEELCTKYDVDGVELDFQRAPYFFHEKDLERGRAVMSAHIERIRRMMDRVGRERGKHLQLGVRALHTVAANLQIGADLIAWDHAGWIDSITVSPYYIQTADVGVEEFAAKCRQAKIYGELNYVHLQLAGTGHNPADRRYVTAEAYRAATLSLLERGADGVSFFNTCAIPQPALGRLTADLLHGYKDLDRLRRSDKNYAVYATGNTLFGRIFPAKDRKEFQIFVADEIPGYARKAALRIETKASVGGVRVEAWVNGTRLEEYTPSEVELFPALAGNDSAPKMERLKFFAVPLSALKFGRNDIKVTNADAGTQSCDFVSAELALYMGKE